MRLPPDESVPVRLRRYLPDHEVRTIGQMGSSGVRNGELLALAAPGFDAFVTVDKSSRACECGLTCSCKPTAERAAGRRLIERPALLKPARPDRRRQ